MHRYLYMCAALAVVGPALFGQGQSHDRSPVPVSREQQAPAAQYSPLAAQGGYSRARTSPLDAMVHSLNPRDVNLGAMWEERRRAWLENAGANRYFWYSFVATIIVILSWFALGYRLIAYGSGGNLRNMRQTLCGTPSTVSGRQRKRSTDTTCT